MIKGSIKLVYINPDSSLKKNLEITKNNSTFFKKATLNATKKVINEYIVRICNSFIFIIKLEKYRIKQEIIFCT